MHNDLGTLVILQELYVIAFDPHRLKSMKIGAGRNNEDLKCCLGFQGFLTNSSFKQFAHTLRQDLPMSITEWCCVSKTISNVNQYSLRKKKKWEYPNST